jgi:hypothetical protein
MNEPISYQANPETRSAAPIQFFEADDNFGGSRRQSQSSASGPRAGRE